MANNISEIVLGHTVRGVPIRCTHVSSREVSAPAVLLIAGVHGDELESFWLIQHFLMQLQGVHQTSCDVYVIPCFNEDGRRLGTRVNANGVDLNRNFPTPDWGALGHRAVDRPTDVFLARYFPGPTPSSEPETTALCQWLLSHAWRGIISIHSYEHPMVNYDEERSRHLATLMSQMCGLPTRGDIGYPTPGSLGTWLAIHNPVPCITFELMEGLPFYTDPTPYTNALWKACE